MDTPLKSVLFISYDGLTDPLGQSQILPYYKALREKGHSISLLSCEKPAAFKKHGATIQSDLTEMGIQWDFVFYHKSPAVVSTYYDLFQLRKKAKQIVRNKKLDLVHCRTILTAGIGLLLQRKGAKFIFDFRGFWADERVDGNIWPQSKFLYRQLYRLFKRKEKKAFLNADQIISLTHSAKEELQAKYNIAPQKIAVVPCSVDLNHFNLDHIKSDEQIDLKTTLKLDGQYPIISYAGSLGTRYLFREMLDCFLKIKDKQPKAHYLIVSNSDTSELEHYAHRLGLDKAITCCSTSYDKIPLYLSLSDLALYFIYPGNSGKAVSPTKQAEFLSLGIPIITNSGIGDSSSILKAEQAGIIIDEFNDRSYEEVAMDVQKLLEISPESHRSVAKKYFALSSGVETYHQVYLKL